MRGTMKTALAVAMACAISAGSAAADTIKIAYIEGMSGPFANVGDAGLKHFQFMIDRINAAGGVAGGQMLEVIAFDNKTNPKESLVQLQKVIDQGIHYITQGNSSAVAAALSDAVAKHNKRNPDSPVLYLNYAAVDPALTNDKCNFWHFRFDADADMKMEAVTDYLADRPDITKIYIIGQDYSFGKAVSAAANRLIAEKRPDIEIVGDELHPIGKVKDFSPYIQKIMASGADAVITGNWGTDMTLLVKAAADAGLDAPFLTYYGGGLGVAAALGDSAVGRLMQITEHNENALLDDADFVAFMDEYEAKYGPLDWYYQRIGTTMDMFAKALNEAGDDPQAVAYALEGMSIDTAYGAVTMREDNHQLLQPLFISTLGKVGDEGIVRQTEDTPYGYRNDFRIEADATATETTCKMRRP